MDVSPLPFDFREDLLLSREFLKKFFETDLDLIRAPLPGKPCREGILYRIDEHGRVLHWERDEVNMYTQTISWKEIPDWMPWADTTKVRWWALKISTTEKRSRNGS